MKRTILAAAIAAIALMISGQAMAANATAKAGVGATIVTPIAIEKMQDLEFGSIAPGLADGTVSVSTDDVRTAKGDLNLLSVGKTPQAAAFLVMGSPDATYTITLPAETTVVDESAANNMLVDSFLSNPDGAGVLDSKGQQDLKVGATLHVAAAQAAGRYTGAFAVTVEYN
jgi:hypothetical protein